MNPIGGRMFQKNWKFIAWTSKSDFIITLGKNNWVIAVHRVKFGGLNRKFDWKSIAANQGEY